MARLPDMRSEDGFTLIELMVVVGILGVILVMATSTFAGVKSRAQDSAAKATAATALETGRIVFTDTASYASVFPDNLTAAEPSLSFVNEVTNSSGPNNASTGSPIVRPPGISSWRRSTVSRGSASTCVTGSPKASGSQWNRTCRPPTAPQTRRRR